MAAIFKYVVVAEPFLCIGALLEMIIFNLSKIIIDQKEVGEFFGLHIPHDYPTSVKKNISFTSNPLHYGIAINNAGLNPFFKYHGLQLQEQYFPIEELMDFDFERTINFLITNEYDVILSLSYGKLFSTDELNSIGHAILLTDVNDQNVGFYDPGPQESGFKITTIDNLFLATKHRAGGISAIKRN